MTINKINWDVPFLDAVDERLVNAYMEVGCEIYDLPHTKDITRLIQILGEKDIDMAKHFVFKRLLTLRRRGQLPHAFRSSGS